MNSIRSVKPRLVTALYSQTRLIANIGDLGSGIGQGGTIREAGGSFAKTESAQEDQYFYNEQKEQLAKLRTGLHDEIIFHEQQIKNHLDAISRHTLRLKDMSK